MRISVEILMRGEHNYAGECQRREGMLRAEREEFSSIIKVKREKLEESSVLAAQMQGALQERVQQLRTLSGQASEYGKELADLHLKMTQVAEKVLEVQEAMECSVCMENTASTALIPCGHCFCCLDGCVSKEVSTCPCCRSAVTGRTELFGAWCISRRLRVVCSANVIYMYIHTNAHARAHAHVWVRACG